MKIARIFAIAAMAISAVFMTGCGQRVEVCHKYG